MVCDTGRVSDFSLPWWSLQFARQANQINNVEPKEASGNAVSWEKTGNKSCVFSVLLLYVTEVTDCHLWPGAAFFFLPDFGTHQDRPKPIRIPDSRKGFPWQLSSQLRVPFSFLCSRCTQRPLDVGGWEPGPEARDWFIVTSLCISVSFRKISKRIRWK